MTTILKIYMFVLVAKEIIIEFNFKEYLILFLAGIAAFTIDYFKSEQKELKIIAASLIMVISIVFFIVPALAEYFQWSLKISVALTWALAYFKDKAMKGLEQYLNKKSDQLIN